MDTEAWLIIAIIATNALNSLVGAFWGKRAAKAKDAEVKTLERQLQSEGALKDERIKGLQDQLALATEMNDLKFREIICAQRDGYKDQLPILEGDLKDAEDKVKTLEANAAASAEELAEARVREKTLEKQLEEARKDGDAADRLSRVRGRTWIADVPYYSGGSSAALQGRYIPPALGDTGFLQKDPGKEGKSA